MSEPLLVLGGGTVGRAVAAAERGPVIVASRTEGARAGLWVRADLSDDGALLPWPCRVVCAVAPGAREAPGGAWSTALLARLARYAGRAVPVTVVGPAGAGHPVLDAFDRFARAARERGCRVLRVGPVFGADDRLAWPIATALRAGKVARIPAGSPRARVVAAGDVARVALAEAGAPGEDFTICGPEPLDLPTMADVLVGRFGGRWQTTSWRPGWPGSPWRADEWARASAHVEVAGAWNSTAWGSQTPFSGWVQGLAGMRRRS
jgi:hypothetical protein